MYNEDNFTLLELTDLFLNQETNMVDRDSASSKIVMMVSSTNPKVMVATRNKYYGNLNPTTGQAIDKPVSPIVSSLDPTLNVFPTELTINPPKGVIHRSAFNHHARAAHHYNIIEDLAQDPSAMSTLKVLQNCPTQKKGLLSVIRCIDP